MPKPRRARRPAMLPESERLEDELYGFLRQSCISPRNIKRLHVIAGHLNPRIRSLAELILEIARVKPGKRRRIPVIARRHWDLFVRMATVLDDAFWDDFFFANGEQGEWLWERWEEARQEARFRAYGKSPCWCGSGQPYWSCCAERDDAVAAQLEAEAQARERALNPEVVPWQHPDRGVDHLTRSAYELFYIDPDHPWARPPPEWRDAQEPTNSRTTKSYGSSLHTRTMPPLRCRRDQSDC